MKRGLGFGVWGLGFGGLGIILQICMTSATVQAQQAHSHLFSFRGRRPGARQFPSTFPSNALPLPSSDQLYKCLMPVQPFWSFENDHRKMEIIFQFPVWICPCLFLNFSDRCICHIQSFDHFCIYFVVIAFHNDRLITITFEQRFQIFIFHPAENGRAGDLVAVQMEYRKHCAIFGRIDEFGKMPCGRRACRFVFTVADKTCHDEVRIVQNRPVRGRKRVTEFSTLEDDTGCRRA